MSTRLFRNSITICLMVSALLTSCAVRLPSLSGPRGFQDETAKQAERLFAHGEFRKVLDLYSKQVDKYRDKKSLENYLMAGERIRHAADEAFEANNFARAGSIYTLLLENRIAERDEHKTLSFDDDYLNKQITACSRSLNEAGLRKYREEKLLEAIAIWEEIMTFDPNNSTVAKAIQTANRQLQGLKSVR